MLSALTIRPPNSVQQKIKKLAERDQIPVNQFVASAAAEQMAAVMTLDDLKAGGPLGQRADFEQFLRLLPDAPAAAGDEPAEGPPGA